MDELKTKKILSNDSIVKRNEVVNGKSNAKVKNNKYSEILTDVQITNKNDKMKVNIFRQFSFALTSLINCR